MTRKEKVFNELRKICENITLKKIEEGFCEFDATIIGKKAGVSRNNTSKELNVLLSEKIVIKIQGRPVCFFDRNKIEEILDITLSDEQTELKSMSTLINLKEKTQDSGLPPQNVNIFDEIIGSEGSLKMPIEQAKAAILYPPMGLNTLLIGPTGVGKTTFAEMMYNYAVKIKRIKTDGRFTIFNCSEYADNPQLLLSQLFGYVKGAFTGATVDKPGLIEKTDGGILLLDEIHRLTSEGQEMLFLFMDKGIYRRLGETENTRKANVLLIGATTENINCSLLKTFLRRIPVVIKLPALSERPFTERLRLVKQFFRNEAKRVNVPIKVHKNIIKAFLLYDCEGNIGQFKGDIQLTCARGFLEYKTYGKKLIEIDTPLLPEHINSGLFNSSRNNDEMANLIHLDVKKYYIFSKFEKGEFTSVDKYDISETLYKEISDKYYFYSQKGYSQQQTNEIVNGYIEEYLETLLKKYNVKKEISENKEIFKVISSRVYYAVEMALKVVEQKSKRKFSKKVKIGMSMHISSLIERIEEGGIVYNSQINKIVLNNLNDFDNAKLIRKILEEELEINIPEEEIGFIAMFLYAIDSDKEKKNNAIGILVLAHGKKTASSMVDVANSLLGTNHAKAIDMPLDQKIEDVLEKTVELVKEIDNGKGVLLLVDMGSLIAFSEIITKKTNIETYTVEMVSTPMVIEAVRKSLFPEMTLNQLTEEIQKISPYVGRLVTKDIKNKISSKPRTIITTCLTGEGTAIKLTQLLKKYLPIIEEYNITIKPMNIDKSTNLKKDENILAVVGTVDLAIPDTPYIPIDEVIVGDGIERIGKIISGSEKKINQNQSTEFNVIMDILEDTLTFVNPIKAYNTINDTLVEITELISVKDFKELKIKYIFHNCCMLERLIKKEILPYKKVGKLIETKPKLYETIKSSLKIIEETFGVEVPDTEVGYVMDLIDTHMRH